MALIDDLVEALTVLPGVGKKSAQRMALHLLQRDRGGGTRWVIFLGMPCVTYGNVEYAAT